MTIDFANLTPEMVDFYVRSVNAPSQPKRHKYYHQTCHYADRLGVHFDGKNPGELLTTRRPQEPEDIQEYRQKIFTPITKSKAKKVLNVLSRISNNSNAAIVFEAENQSAEEQTLKAYTSEDFPYFDDVNQWLFNVGMKQMLQDPNSVFLVMPNKIPESQTEYIEPYPFIFNSKDVVDYVCDLYYTLVFARDLEVNLGEGTAMDGKGFYIVTKTQLWRSVEVSRVGGQTTYEHTLLYTYEMEDIPVVHFGGDYISGTYPFLYESYVDGVLPYWDEAIREWSDKQAAFVQHVYPERVEYQTECDNPKCRGVGNYVDVIGGTERNIICQKCKGSGYITGRSPYGTTVVKPTSNVEKERPFPGVEYIQKDTDIINILNEDIEKLINDGYAAINMDMLKEVGENQSGIAKTIDRTDLDGYLIKVSNNLFNNILYNVYYFTAKWRYPSQKTEDIMPTINAPNTFNVLTSLNAMQEIATAKTAGVDQLVTQLTLDAIDKRWSNDKWQREYSRNVIELDPLYGKNENDKGVILMNNGISEDDYYISENISRLVMLAMKEDEEGFNALPYADKITKLKEMADTIKKQELVIEHSQKSQKLQMFDTNGKPIDSQTKDKAQTQDGQKADEAAQLKIRSTVGGMTNLIGLNQAVNAGQMTVDAAVQIAVQFLGIEESIAKGMIELVDVSTAKDVAKVNEVLKSPQLDGTIEKGAQSQG